MNLLILVTFYKIFGFFYIDNRVWSEILASPSQPSRPFTIIIVVWLIFTGPCFQREQERCLSSERERIRSFTVKYSVALGVLSIPSPV